MAGEAIVFGVLRGVASNLSSPVLNEFWLFWGVEEKKQKLESNLSAIRAALQDAERRQANENLVRDWLGKLKLAAYDAEDLLDEFVAKARRREVENQDGMGKKVRSFFSTSNPIAFNLKMAHKMQKLMARFDDLAKEKEHYRLEGQPPISSAGETRETVSLVNESAVYGRDNEKEKLIDSLIKCGNESVLSIIPIVGMGGLGKTTLAQLVYNDESVVTHFDLRMWVYVSEDFDLEKLLKGILESANKDKTEQLSMDLLLTRLREKLGGKRYLLVLDDVWNDVPLKWDTLKTWLTCGSMGSKVLVTTRNDGVANIMHTLPTHYLQILSEEDSWALFEKLANPHQNLPQNLLLIGKEIVSKCGGLPLAVKTLGGLMSFKKNERDWEDVKNSEFWKPQNISGEILPTLRLSYDHLTSSLKQCFAYCALIPKGNLIDKDKLIMQWIAQGFIHIDEENEFLEERAERYFNELLQRSLFQVDHVETDFNIVHFDGDINLEQYKMHDLIHDLLRNVVGKDCIILEDSKNAVITETRHLFLHYNELAKESKNLEALKKCKKLRSIIHWENFGHDFVEVNVCFSFRCLRVLDLSHTGIHYLPNSIDKLIHLRYLDVTRTRVRKLPETICHLHNLQSLLISRSLIKKLPKDMKRMTSLRHIVCDTYPYLSLPKGIGELTGLRTLSTFVINEESEPGIEELKGLNQLMGNISIKGLENIRNGACAREADLKAKKHLHSLNLHWSWRLDETEGNAEEVINNLEPPSNLKKILVRDYSGLSFPSWMMMLSNLIQVNLRGCIRCEQLPPFEQLPLLESLVIYDMTAIKYIVNVKFDGSHNNKDIFRSLRHLLLCKLPNLKRWSSQQENGDGDEQVILNRLCRLHIQDCPKLIRLPKLLLPALEFLDLNGVGCDRIDLPMCKSLKVLKFQCMPNLERWSSQQENGDGEEQRTGEDEQVILGRLCHLCIHGCPNLIRLPKLLLPALEFLNINGVGCDRIDLTISKSPKKLELKSMPNLERWSSGEVDGDEDDQMIFPSFCTLKIFNCPKLIWLPRLFLPGLETLSMRQVGCDNIEVSTSQSLKRVTFSDMPNLEIWSSREADDDPKVIYPRLQLEVRRCPKMVRLPHLLPSLEELRIYETDERLLRSLANYTSLVRLHIRVFPEVMHLPDEIGPTHANNLLTLDILHGPKLMSLSHQLKYLHSLKELSINSCPELVLPLLDGSQEQQPCPPLNSLKKLTIRASCEKQRLLPGEGMIMTSLEELIIGKCGNLESLCSEGLQNLTSLHIYECPKVWSSPEWLGNLTSLKKLYGVVLDGTTSLTNPLENLKSLEYLSISSGPNMTDFPEWIGNLTSLTFLCIRDCRSIRSLPESLGNLLSLSEMEIQYCRSIRSLPESLGNLLSLSEMEIQSCPALTELPKGLQRLANLQKLSIWRCPVLERRLPKNWKEWKKVAHVPKISIDGRSYSWEAEHPSLMQSLKKGCNKFDKKLHFPTCASSSSP